MNSLADIETVVEDVVERTAFERFAAIRSSRTAGPFLGPVSLVLEFILESTYTFEFQVAFKNVTNGFCLGGVDDQPPSSVSP